MFILRVDYKTGQQFSLLFRDGDNADGALAAVKALATEPKGPAFVDLTDDHGHTITLMKGEITSILLTDLVVETAGVHELQALQKAMAPEPDPSELHATRFADEPAMQQHFDPRAGFLPGPDVSNVDPRYARAAARPDLVPFGN